MLKHNGEIYDVKENYLNDSNENKNFYENEFESNFIDYRNIKEKKKTKIYQQNLKLVVVSFSMFSQQVNQEILIEFFDGIALYLTAVWVMGSKNPIIEKMVLFWK